jgi:hypothetical protein
MVVTELVLEDNVSDLLHLLGFRLFPYGLKVENLFDVGTSVDEVISTDALGEAKMLGNRSDPALKKQRITRQS